MSRYTTLIKSTEPLYAEGSPIFIAANALLKDNDTENILLQLKFKNISDNIISAVKVYVKAFDISGKKLECVEEYQYLDLSAAKGTEFGQNRAITLPNPNTRQFTVACTEIIFNNDSSIKLDKEIIWEKLPSKKMLEEHFEKNLCEQYRRDTFQEAKYVVEDYKDLWFCSCGHINKNVKNVCEVCNNNKLHLLSVLDKDVLNEHFELHKKEEAEREEKLKILKAKKAKEDKIKAQKLAKVGIVVAIIVIICIIVGILIKHIFIPMSTYSDATELMKNGEFEEAIVEFKSLGDYKDSKDQITQCENGIKEEIYKEALSLFKSDQFDEAITVFESLGDYKDSKEQIENINIAKKEEQYQKALKLLDEKEYDKARRIFQKIKKYKDSEKQLEICAEGKKESIYLEAFSLINERRYGEAYEKFYSIIDYKDSKEQREQLKEKLIYSTTYTETVFWGHYEQDNNLSNGKELIEWNVIKKDKNKLLLEAKNSLDSKQFNSVKLTSLSWENSDLYYWLNNTFLNNAFTEQEQEIIINNGFGKIYIYSIEESNYNLLEFYTVPTEYAKSKGYDDTWMFWTRSPLQNQSNVWLVGAGWTNMGIKYLSGVSCDEYHYVRPIMWVEIPNE